MCAAQQFNIFDFSNFGEPISGQFTLADFTELPQMLSGESQSADVSYCLKPLKMSKRGLPAVELTLKAVLTTACVYCAEPCRIKIEKTMPFLLTRTEQEADGLPIEEDGDYDVIVGSEHFDLTHLVEEELMLSLPAFPRHDLCRFSNSETDKAAGNSQNRPFSNLSDLLHKVH